MIELISKKVKSHRNHRANSRPYVTLAFAQSLDGSISFDPDWPCKISNDHSWRLTHEIRSLHDAILVGIGTLLADDPLLNVRLVTGPNPQPVVVDSRLRFPLKARLLHSQLKPWVAVTPASDDRKKEIMEDLGARILRLPAMENGWVKLTALLEALYRLGIRSLMVEGGARIITSFLREKLADQLVLTIAPCFLGGYRAVGDFRSKQQLKDLHMRNLDDDLIICGDFVGQ